MEWDCVFDVMECVYGICLCVCVWTWLRKPAKFAHTHTRNYVCSSFVHAINIISKMLLNFLANYYFSHLLRLTNLKLNLACVPSLSRRWWWHKRMIKKNKSFNILRTTIKAIHWNACCRHKLKSNERTMEKWWLSSYLLPNILLKSNAFVTFVALIYHIGITK